MIQMLALRWSCCSISRKSSVTTIHDVDNRLKDILECTTGTFRRPKSVRRKYLHSTMIARWSRVVIEKQPFQSLSDDAADAYSIRRYEPRRWPLQRTKGDQFHKPSQEAPAR